MTVAIHRWSGGGSDDGDGTVPTPRGTTQVVTRGKLIIIIVGLDRWQVRIRCTRYCSLGYEVVVWQWRLRANFVRDFKSLEKEADESLAKHKALELEIDRLLRAVVSQDIMSIVKNPSVVSAQKDTTKGTSVNTQFCKQSILGKPPSSSKPKLYAVTPFPNSKGLPKIDKTHALSKPVTSNSAPTPQESEVMNNDKVIAPGMFRNNPFKPSREEKYVPNKVRASVRTYPITVSQPHVILKKDVNSDSNGLSSTGVDNTAKTRRPQPRSNTKNGRVPSASKSSCNKNKEVEVEEHPRNLLLSKNKEHMSSECNHVKLAIQNDKFEVVCVMCKQCLITANHDVCVLNYVNDMNSSGKKQKANVSNTEDQNKQKPKVIKPKNVGSKERLASPKPSNPRFCLRWSPTGRLFDIKGKIIASSESESQSDCSNGDNACTSNPSEPKIKRFPNSTFFLGRLHLLHMDLCGPMRIASINGKRTDNDTEFKNQILKEYFDSVGIFHQASFVRTPQQNGVVEQRNQTLVEAARTMLIFSHAPLFLWAEAIATACYTQNRSIIHRRFNKTPAENRISPFYMYMGLSVIPRMFVKILGSLVQKVILAFSLFILLIPVLIELNLTYARSTITTQQPTEGELDLLFEAMHDDYISGQLSVAPRNTLAAQAPLVLQTPIATTTTADIAPTPTNSSS
ncbi:retrovirus-related pol polyprotein from transposon TNT 1-94 [Tanacetum coccineum]